MVNTIYYANESEEIIKICVVDYKGLLIGNAQIKPNNLSDAIEMFKEHLQVEYENNYKTKIKEVSSLDYDEILYKGIKNLQGSRLKRETLLGDDPTNKLKN